MKKERNIYTLPAISLFVLGILDLIRGFFHTFNIRWAAENVARLDLSVAGNDQLVLLGSFGLSNFLTGIIFICISLKVKRIAPYIILFIPLSYALGIIGLKLSQVSREAAFNGQYFMFAYIGFCILVFIKFLYDKRTEKIKI